MEGFYRRPLPEGLVPFASARGRQLFREALASGGMEGWFALAEHAHTQSDPAFCGLGSLVMVLNALAIDPGRTWKAPWRWYAEELLDCCEPLDEVRRTGTTLGHIACLARCNGATADVRRGTLDALRADLVEAAEQPDGPCLIASFSRSALGQTGEGHFSPLGGWHRASDLVLVLDVARFKYPAFWVPLARLHAAMSPPDPATGAPRGWIRVGRAGAGEPSTWRIACERGGWREELRGALVDLASSLHDEPPDSVAALVERMPPFFDTVIGRRADASEDVLAALAGSTLLDVAKGREGAAVLLLAAPDAWLPVLPPAVVASLRDHREGPPALAAEGARLRVQIEAITALCWEPTRAPRAGPVVERSVTIAASPTEVWRAITDPDLAAKWMGGLRIASSWEVGSPITFRGTLHGLDDYVEHGTLLAFEPGKLLQYEHWSRLWRVADVPENRARFTLWVEPDAGVTRVSLRHDLPAVEAIAQHSDFFWRVGLELLRKLVEG